MSNAAPNVQDVATEAPKYDAGTLDYYVVQEVKAQVARIGMAMVEAGETFDPTFTASDVADLVGLSKYQIARRFSGHAGFSLDEIVQVAEALNIEPHALIRAALMRMRLALGIEPKRLRDQVLAGPTGLPTIQ